MMVKNIKIEPLFYVKLEPTLVKQQIRSEKPNQAR